jgi:hypothetical protein
MVGAFAHPTLELGLRPEPMWPGQGASARLILLITFLDSGSCVDGSAPQFSFKKIDSQL